MENIYQYLDTAEDKYKLTRMIAPFVCSRYLMLDEYNSLSKDLFSLYENQIATDVTLCVKDGSLRAHKAILCARSSEFTKMFQQDSRRNFVYIEDLDMATLKEFLDFIYSKVRDDYDIQMAKDLYEAADKFKVKKLKDSCASSLYSHKNEDNVGDLLKFAFKYDDKEMKILMMRFVSLRMKKCVKKSWFKEIVREQSDLSLELVALSTSLREQ